MGLGAPGAIVCSEPLVVFDAEMRVVHLNRAAESLLGQSAAEAAGKSCQAVLHGRDARGAPSCAAGCRQSRYARHGWPVPRMQITIDTASGPKPVGVSTIVLRGEDGPLLCRLLHEEPARPRAPAAATSLTARQREVLSLLADGVPARAVAQRLGITETTVRNHIRAVLLELGAHSQLEAVARARALGIIT